MKRGEYQYQNEYLGGFSRASPSYAPVLLRISLPPYFVSLELIDGSNGERRRQTRTDWWYFVSGVGIGLGRSTIITKLLASRSKMPILEHKSIKWIWNLIFLSWEIRWNKLCNHNHLYRLRLRLLHWIIFGESPKKCNWLYFSPPDTWLGVLSLSPFAESEPVLAAFSLFLLANSNAGWEIKKKAAERRNKSESLTVTASTWHDFNERLMIVLLAPETFTTLRRSFGTKMQISKLIYIFNRLIEFKLFDYRTSSW